MTRRPEDGRGYTSERSSGEHGRRRRRSHDSRGDHRRRPQSEFEHYQHHSVDMQTINGSDKEDLSQMLYREPESGSRYGHVREAVEREITSFPPVLSPDDQIREGIVFEYMNYYEFLRHWFDECNRIFLKKDKRALPKRISETITPATRAEKARIVLPAGVFNRNSLLHCDIVIEGLPPSVFFGSGFGTKSSLARGSAAKDLVDKFFRVGLISEVLHSSIGNHPFFRKRDLPRKDYSLAVEALIDLDRKISLGRWPWDLNTARELEPDTLDRLKAVFNSVVEEVYLGRSEHRARDEFVHPPMAAIGEVEPNFADNGERSEFCHRCRVYGHSDRYCQEGRGRSRERGQARSPGPGRDSRTLYPEEYDPRSEMYDRRGIVENERLQYTQDEIAYKIARQREELLRQEIMLQQSEGVDDRFANDIACQPLVSHSVMPSRGDHLRMHGAIQPLMSPLSPPVDPLLMERQLRAARDEELRAKLEAKAQKLEEERRLKQKEEELERRMQRELEEKKRIMEEEIRRQVQLEERAKLQMELTQTQHQLPLMAEQPFSGLPWQNRVNSSYAQPSLSSTFAPSAHGSIGGVNEIIYSSAPDFEMEEIRLLIKETEEKLLELKRNCREAELSSISQSRAFRMVAELGENAYMLDRTQKQMLLSELKELLSQVGKKERSNKINERPRSRDRSRGARRPRSRSYRERRSYHRSRSRSSRIRDTYKHGIPKDKDRFKEVQIEVGGVTFRNLSPNEQRHLKVGDLVAAKDMKTGKWTTARLAKLTGDSATLSIGNTTWKKDLSDLYKEVPEWS